MKISKISVVGYSKLNDFKTKNCTGSNTQINGLNELNNLRGASFGLFFKGIKTVHLNEDEANAEKDMNDAKDLMDKKDEEIPVFKFPKPSEKLLNYEPFNRNSIKIEENPLENFEIYSKNLFELNSHNIPRKINNSTIDDDEIGVLMTECQK